jgi:enoyl-CoA hydratase/carnithine racemase
MNERIKIDIVDHVADVVLDRPEKHNAVDAAMFEAFIEVGAALAAERSLRAVVLRGAGDNFCAGIDISVFSAGGSDPSWMRPGNDTPANVFQSAAYVWRRMPVPVIAALHGVVFGAGLQVALGADLRIARADASLSIMEVKWGLIPDMAMTTALPGLLPYDRAAELTWTGRIISGEEAASIGLVSRLDDDPAAAARRLAEQIAGKSPDAVRAAKRLLNDAYADRDAGLLQREAELQLQVMAAPNHREAVAANLEKREPRFGDASA